MLNDFSVLLPAAGLGTRLKSNKPKALTRFIDNEYLFQKQIDCINDSLGCPEIHYVCGFQHEKISKKIKKQANVIINERFEQTNVGYSLGLGLKQITSPNVLIIYGDLFFEEDTLNDIAASGQCSWLMINQALDNDEVGCLDIDNRARNLDYGFSYKWSQIAYLKDKERQLYTKFATSPDNHKKLGFELMNQTIQNGGRFSVIESKNYLVDIDGGQDINKINEYLE